MQVPPPPPALTPKPQQSFGSTNANNITSNTVNNSMNNNMNNTVNNNMNNSISNNMHNSNSNSNSSNSVRMSESTLFGKHILVMARYHEWSVERIFDAVVLLPDDSYYCHSGLVFRSIHGTLSHLNVSEQLWKGRMDGIDMSHLHKYWNDDPYRGMDPTSPSCLWEELCHDRATLMMTYRSVCRTWVEYVQERTIATGFSNTFSYRDTNGVESSQQLGFGLLHVFNHASYHLGQVSAALTHLSRIPPCIDMTEWQRLNKYAATDHVLNVCSSTVSSTGQLHGESSVTSVPKRHRRTAFTRPGYLQRLRLDTTAKHEPEQKSVPRGSVRDGVKTGERGGSHVQAGCILCSGRLRLDNGKRKKTGSQTSFFCKICTVPLCVRTRGANQVTCWHLWHTTEFLKSPDKYDKL